MTTHHHMQAALRRQGRDAPARRADALEFRLLFAALLPVFLAVETLARLKPGRRPPEVSGTRRGSVWEEAKAATYRAVPLAFMG
ncbi:hypothetical protein [Salinarimonas sp.]|uniref:hypothetical protein n=1 Tax=Salinarimonas sp. TaxID=2766526 RepID=UPI00391A4D7F